jgi:hypothetical protein
MSNSLVLMADLAWLVIVPFLFRPLGPRRGVLLALVGGFLFLPRTDQIVHVGPWALVVNKQVVFGLTALLGVVLFDRRTLLSARPNWADLPMAAFVVWPLITIEIHGYHDRAFFFYRSWWNLASWAIPYLLGRLYFGSAEGTRAIAVALVAGGLLYVPLCVYEMVMGPKWYLLGLIYGIPSWSNTNRLGGWRPEVFLGGGAEIAAWMALAAVMACWFWIGRCGRPVRRLPAWLPALVLLLTALGCRGVYGYLLLAIGLLAIVLTQSLRTRLVLLALLLPAPIYIGLRISGAWDGRMLETLSRRLGREGTVEARLHSEDIQIEQVRKQSHGLLFGGWSIDWADPWWAVHLSNGGLIGVALFYASFFIVPTVLMVAHFSGQTTRGSPIAAAWGLALFLALHMIDSLHNTVYLTPTPLIGGALTGLVLSERRRRQGSCSAHGSRGLHFGLTSETVRLLLILILWGVLELIGHLPRTPRP